MSATVNLPQPIPYQGSKRLLASTILGYLPDDPPRFVEPFAGSAALSLAMAHRNNRTHFWLNDAHAPLMNLWQTIIHHPEDIAKDYSAIWHEQLGQERTYFDFVRDRFNLDHSPADFLYLLARCVKAAVRYNVYGEFNNTPDNRRLGAKPSEMRRRIQFASSLMHGRTTVTALDYKEVLSNCNDTDLIYMDPPYQGVTTNRDGRYSPTVDHDEFCDELAKLVAEHALFAVSYDGRTGEKSYGEPLSATLGLTHLEIKAGRSSQATLLGRNLQTYESLYLSPRLVEFAKDERRFSAQGALL